MTLDEIRHQLSTAREIPHAALSAAVEQAEALAPEVTELIDLACKSVLLTRPQEKLLFYGVHALASARRTELYVPLLALIEWRPDDLEWLLSEAELHPLLVSTCGPEDEAPFDLLENPAIQGPAKSSLFLLAARLVWEGRASRAEFEALLDRFDRDATTDPDDMAWFGWQSAIALLGLTQFEERVRAGWRAGRMVIDRDIDRQEWAEELHRAVRDPRNEQPFIDIGAAPIGDLAVALRRFGFFGHGDEEEDAADPDDPARDIRLTKEERTWLEYFLNDEIVPSSAMTLESIDGFLTALIAGPKEVPHEEWWPRIWSDLDIEEPDFETEEQERYVRELIDRHRETIHRRLKSGYRHKPWIEEGSDASSSEDWAVGFLAGLDMRAQAWEPLHKHKQGAFAIASIMLLLPMDYLPAEEQLEPLDDGSRAPIVGNLPDLIRMIHAFWHNQPILPLFEPRRSQKIGRNEPCPCGSGRKYKKCCGANVPA